MATENIENKIFAGENNISVEQVEEAVISALLLDAGAIVGTFPVLKPEMFSRPDPGIYLSGSQQSLRQGGNGGYDHGRYRNA